MATRQRFLSHRSLAFGTGRVRGILPKVSRRRHSPQPASSLISATSSFMLDRPLHITKATACVIVSAEEDVRAVKDLTSCASTRAERGPKEIAQEIQPSKEARDSTQGTPRLELDLWVKAHEALVKEVEAAKEKVSSQHAHGISAPSDLASCNCTAMLTICEAACWQLGRSRRLCWLFCIQSQL